jgi:hypothetical protein
MPSLMGHRVLGTSNYNGSDSGLKECPHISRALGAGVSCQNKNLERNENGYG